ncbi:MAG TPA: ABC-type transport auxiliary lipoprotein family protein [bacterium]|nr:ABC-type transport auxiliary lipoprotein family protein [bacterium]HPG85019.1 ABC-type transport auxiliary lipoprotein family protein [bacterium]
MKRLFRLSLLLGLLLLLGCGSRATLARKYYLIESDARVDTWLLDVPEPFLVTACIGPVRVADPYQDTRIAQRSESNELVYYYYNFWADKPGEMAANMLLRAFRESGVFREVSRQNRGEADVMITCAIDALERSREAKNDLVRAAGSFRLVYLQSNTTLLTYEFDKQTRLRKDRSMNAFASAVSKLLFSEMEEFVFRVADYYQYPPD